MMMFSFINRETKKFLNIFARTSDLITTPPDNSISLLDYLQIT